MYPGNNCNVPLTSEVPSLIRPASHDLLSLPQTGQ